MRTDGRSTRQSFSFFDSSPSTLIFSPPLRFAHLALHFSARSISSFALLIYASRNFPVH